MSENMQIFNFYIDEDTKLKAQLKLCEIGVVGEKGALAALIRVLLREFIDARDPATLSHIAQKVQENYTYTTKRNKRSRL